MQNQAKGSESGAGKRRIARPVVELITNTKPASEDCRWCDALTGQVHSAACPNGERYWQVQKLGGVPWSANR